jgi:hypothetical protein
MRPYVGGGWHIVHLSDRVVELRKDSYAYRRLTGADGFVRCRGEPGLDRDQLLHRAVQQAHKSDEALAHILAADVMPTANGVSKYRRQLQALAHKFGTGQESQAIGVKRA